MDVPADQKVYYTTRKVSAKSREKRLEYSRAYYQSHKKDLMKRSNDKYANDLEYKAKKIADTKYKYDNDPIYRQRQLDCKQKHYQRKKANSIE